MNFKIVLDTNIFISGIHWNGPSHRIIEMWKEGKFEVICSLEIIEEIMRILEKFKVPLSIEELSFWENLLLTKTTIVNPAEKVTIVTDPDDNKFIEAALEGEAKYTEGK